LRTGGPGGSAWPAKRRRKTTHSRACLIATGTLSACPPRAGGPATLWWSPPQRPRLACRLGWQEAGEASPPDPGNPPTGARMKTDSLTDTGEFLAPPPSEAAPPGPPSASVQVDLAALSHLGKVRPNNEDNFLVVRFGRFLDTLLSSLPGG